MSLASHAAWLEDDQPLWLEVALHSSQGASQGGAATIDIELVEVPR